MVDCVGSVGCLSEEMFLLFLWCRLNELYSTIFRVLIEATAVDLFTRYLSSAIIIDLEVFKVC